MTYTDDQLIDAIQQGGARQEHAIRHLYEQCFYMIRDGGENTHSSIVMIY